MHREGVDTRLDFDPIFSPRLFIRIAACCAVLTVFVVACQLPGGSAPTAAPAPTATNAQTEAAPTVTNTLVPTPTPPTPPSEGQIAYTCQLFAEGLQDQICLMQPDGSGQRRLTRDDLADHFYPSLSPGGDSVLYSSNMEGPYEIYEHPLEGEPTRLTFQGNNYAPAASPDGSLIAYTHTDEVGAALWLMDRDGSDPYYFLGQAWDATWSPDGAWILHASDRAGSIQLWRIRPDGSDLQPVTNFEGLRGRNDWSAQDRLATYAGPGWNREIILFDLDGQNRTQVTDGGNNLAPSFSPSGEWFAYTSYVDRYRDDNGCEIYVQHIESGLRFRLTDNTYCDWQPRWGPDPDD